jgi:hypothetical protein
LRLIPTEILSNQRFGQPGVLGADAHVFDERRPRDRDSPLERRSSRAADHEPPPMPHPERRIELGSDRLMLGCHPHRGTRPHRRFMSDDAPAAVLRLPLVVCLAGGGGKGGGGWKDPWRWSQPKKSCCAGRRGQARRRSAMRVFRVPPRCPLDDGALDVASWYSSTSVVAGRRCPRIGRRDRSLAGRMRMSPRIRPRAARSSESTSKSTSALSRDDGVGRGWMKSSLGRTSESRHRRAGSDRPR